MISKNEHIMTYLYSKEKEVGLITADYTETTFYLYEPVGNDYKKLGKADSPIELEKRYKMRERMGME